MWISIAITAAADANPNNTDKQGILKNCAPFTFPLNNTQIDNSKYLDIVMYNFYAKTSHILFQYYRDEPALDYNAAIVNFTDNNTAHLNLKNRSNRWQLYKEC